MTGEQPQIAASLPFPLCFAAVREPSTVIARSNHDNKSRKVNRPSEPSF
jgi:hypothetical protein